MIETVLSLNINMYCRKYVLRMQFDVIVRSSTKIKLCLVLRAKSHFLQWARFSNHAENHATITTRNDTNIHELCRAHFLYQEMPCFVFVFWFRLVYS